VDGNPDATLEQIREKLGVSCTVVTIHHTLWPLGYRYKKRCGPANKIALISGSREAANDILPPCWAPSVSTVKPPVW
jgi:hypothetical protein